MKSFIYLLLFFLAAPLVMSAHGQSPPGDRLVFWRNGDIVLYNPAANTETQLTDGLRSRSGAVWSPDGATLAMVVTGEGLGASPLATLDWQSNEIRTLTPDTLRLDEQPVWSHDGQTLFFVAFEGGGTTDLYSVTANGTDLTTLIQTSDTHFGDITLTPDENLLLLRERDYFFWDISSEARYPLTIFSDDLQVRDVRWSPDGAFLTAYDRVEEQHDIWLADCRTGDVRNLTNSPDQTERFPRWSPDGTWIGVEVQSDGSSEEQIAVLRPDEGPLQPIGPLFDSIGTFRWSPDSQWIALHARDLNGNDQELYLISADGSQIQQLTNNDVDDMFPRFAPSGDTAKNVLIENNRCLPMVLSADEGQMEAYNMALLQQESGPPQIVILTGSSRLQGVEPLPRFGGQAAWSPDGKTLAYLSDSRENDGLVLVDSTTAQVRAPSFANGTLIVERHLLAWSLDGSSLVFAATVRDTRETSLYRLDAASGTLSEPMFTFQLRRPYLEAQHGFVFAADGRGLGDGAAFALDLTSFEQIPLEVPRLSPSEPFDWMPNAELLVVTENELRRIAADGTQTPLYTFEEGLAIRDIRISPDGEQLAFYSRSEAQGNVLMVMPAEGGSPALVQAGFNGPLDFDWTPDGNWIVLAGFAQDGPGLFRVRPDGTGFGRLTELVPGNERTPLPAITLRPELE